nr:hypothetical protein [Human alphaherpesvirus 2]
MATGVRARRRGAETAGPNGNDCRRPIRRG